MLLYIAMGVFLSQPLSATASSVTSELQLGVTVSVGFDRWGHYRTAYLQVYQQMNVLADL